MPPTPPASPYNSVLADTDSGLLARHEFFEEIEQTVNGTNPGAALLVVYLPYYQLLTNHVGYEAADRMVAHSAHRLYEESLLPEEAVVGQLEASRLAVFVPSSTSVDARDLAHAIREQFEDPLTLFEEPFYQSIKIGVAHQRDDQESPSLLYRRASLALQDADQHVGSQVRIFESRSNEKNERWFQRDRALREGIAKGELTLFCQPIVSLGSGELERGEFLVRWEHDGELIPPKNFLPLAQQTGAIIPMGKEVIRQALGHFQRWQDQELNVQAGFNLSVGELEHRGMLRLFGEQLGARNLNPNSIVVEVTETASVSDPELLERLRQLGVSVSIDDFGDGHTSLRYLRQLSADELKLDRSFLAELGQSDTVSELVEAVISAAKSYGLTVVGEGVETKNHARRLRELGCQLGQGFYFGRPMPVEDFEQAYLSDG